MKKKILIAVSVFLLTIFLLFLFLNDNRKLTIIEVGIKESVLLVQKGINIPIKYLSDKFSGVIDPATSSESCDEVNIKDKYEETLKELNDIKDNLDLENTLIEYEIVNAYTINRNIGYWYDTLTIDKGSNDKIKTDMAVITKKGLIGKVIKTTPTTSSIKLLTSVSSKNQISVKINVNDVYIYGLLTNYQSGYFILEGISENAVIESGSIVTTTGLDNIYPSGIEIGKVDKIETDNFDLAKTVYIKSSVDFDNINYVMVIKRSDIK